MRIFFKFLQSYFFILAVAGVIVLYLMTNISKRRQLNLYQRRLDSTTALLDKISQLQAQNQTKVLKTIDALLDTATAIAFDTTTSPLIRTANQDTISKVVTSFLGTANAEKVDFGAEDYCMFSVEMKDIRMSLRLNRSRDSIEQALVQSYAVEKVVECKEDFNPTLPHQQLYNIQSFVLKGDTLNIFFLPSVANQPKCRVIFYGTLVGNKITGRLIWQRYDMEGVPGYNYRISVPITLY